MDTSKGTESDSGGVGGAGGGGIKGKSCKGYLYYSSTLKSNGINPRCVGIPRSLPQVPSYIVGQSEVEASQEGRTLTDFYYACAGYSVHVNDDNKHPSTDQEHHVTKTQLPVCVGLELLVDRRVAASDKASAPAHVHSREDGHEHTFPQPQPHKSPAHPSADDFLSRFTRNANLVASGVARNVRRVGNYVKQSVDDILYPYRRRPK
ncbi:hypothetical protein K2173_006104 [Erythroxylum novogranatense]|uniref:DUF8204 domain-containing protein n=1 Tax=Erythroxylum novogranatense TaxID=1862640 RepID=A0AAV8TDH4_9ROSI|nr:hypothetical protein K2173_006104 [Erythroxylum novogranatense]